MSPAFTPAHRGGSGSPLVRLHGFTDTWRTWELVAWIDVWGWDWALKHLAGAKS